MRIADQLRANLRTHGDAEKAPQMQAYMKSEMPFLGVIAPERRLLIKEAVAKHWPTPKQGSQQEEKVEWRETVEDLWRNATHREELYAALDLADHPRFKQYQDLELLPLYQEMIVTGAWWDLVDRLATWRIGHLLRHFPESMTPILDQWSMDDDLWLRRTAILAQLKSKQHTDPGLLKRWIEPSLEHQDFFLRKGIGWALREFAKTEPNWVIQYVRQHATAMSPLSIREALRRVLSPEEIRSLIDQKR